MALKGVVPFERIAVSVTYPRSMLRREGFPALVGVIGEELEKAKVPFHPVSEEVYLEYGYMVQVESTGTPGMMIRLWDNAMELIYSKKQPGIRRLKQYIDAMLEAREEFGTDKPKSFFIESKQRISLPDHDESYAEIVNRLVPGLKEGDGLYEILKGDSDSYRLRTGQLKITVENGPHEINFNVSLYPGVPGFDFDFSVEPVRDNVLKGTKVSDLILPSLSQGQGFLEQLLDGMKYKGY